ncbi:hypothetical protein L3X38_038043 [Prunus dulcis]|uniref:Uncharacterized protein n=1 Tax=Prunus dulcis TaxID=3755 RepID=A0AAD4V4H4_PRUDU|nr:hypothetical protein L3X38_038043 [Prunus dulcis]
MPVQLAAWVGCDLYQTDDGFYCYGAVRDDHNAHLNITHPYHHTPLSFAHINPPDPSIFHFGIFLYALQSNTTRSTSIPLKMFQSFWWGLRNLSSFGSNLEISLYGVEIFFTILVSISGMVLFLIYLNTRIQKSQQRSS